MKRYTLLILITVTSLLVSIPGVFLNAGERSFNQPAAAVTIHAVKNDQIEALLPRVISDRMSLHNSSVEVPEDIAAAIERAGNGTKSESDTVSDNGNDRGGDTVRAEDISEDTDDGQEDEDSESEETEEDETEDDESDDEEDAESEEDVFPKEFTEVSDEYFADACFIGDSRVQGLGLYSDLPGVNYGSVGLQLYKVFDKRVIDTPAGKLTIPEMLSIGPKYGKIYLGFGLNEMGWGNADMFAEYYYTLIDYIKAVQPEATIYVMGVIHVTAGEQASSSIFNNEKVNSRNELLSEVAYNEHVYFLDLNEVFTDENGCLPTEDSFDGIHIRSQAMYKWADYLKSHAIE